MDFAARYPASQFFEASGASIHEESRAMLQWKWVRFAFAALAVTFVVGTGCATLSKSDCLSGDWVRIGKQDGADGRTRSRFAKHVEACEKHGVSPNRLKYEAGYKEGLVTYCTEENGFAVGRRGDRYENVCPASREGSFLSRYRAGKEIYDVESELKSVDSDISSLESKLSSDNLYESDRRRALDKVYRLRADRDSLQRRLITLEVRAEERARRR